MRKESMMITPARLARALERASREFEFTPAQFVNVTLCKHLCVLVKHSSGKFTE